jgi:signal transduction histidine kinase/CheY-like chemotaxis protein
MELPLRTVEDISLSTDPIRLTFSEKEIKRLKNMMEYDLDYEFNNEELHSIAELASFITGLPQAYISLVGIKNTNFLASIGSDMQNTPREKTFCHYCIEQDDFYEIKDTLTDERSKDLPHIKNDPNPLRYYGAYPLKSKEGYNLGSISVCSQEPFELNETTKEALKTLADQVIVQFQLKRQNRLLRDANLKAEKLSKANDDFISNMSHELRTPLNAINGYAEILNKTILDKEQQEAVEIIINSSQILIILVNDILDFSKISCDKLALEKIPFNLDKTLKLICDLLQNKANLKNVILESTLDPKIPKKIIGDKIRINQIIMNLAGNAIKFSQNGSIIISVKIVEESENDISLHFSVRETGKKTLEEKINPIFERYEQAGSQINENFGGTGLGLNISKNLVELHGGQLKVKKVFGEESEFYFTIKYDKLKIIQDEKQKTELDRLKLELIGNNLKKLRILICEDNIVNTKLFKHMFVGKVSHFEIAENGKVAIEILKRKKFDIILMDINMPEMDGLEATELIRNTLKLTIPIIGFTATNSQVEREKCLKVGMNDYFVKSFISEEIYEIISSVILNNKIFKEDFPLSEENILDIKRRSCKFLTIPQINSPCLNLKNYIHDQNVDKKNFNKEKSLSSKQLHTFSENFFSKSFLRSGEIFPICSTNKYLNKSSISSSDDESFYFSDVEDVNKLCLNSVKDKVRQDHIKLDFLKEFSSGDLILEKDIIDLFLSNFPIEFETLLNKILSANLKEIKFWIHRMKSPLSIFGLKLIIKDMEIIQSLCENDNYETALKIFENLNNNLRVVYEEMEKVRSFEYNK